MKRIVTDEDVEKALSFLRDSAADIGAARQQLAEKEALVKATEAILFLQSEEKSVEAKKADVRASWRWKEVSDEHAEAAGIFERMKALREAAAARIECWRSESANYRGMRV